MCVCCVFAFVRIHVRACVRTAGRPTRGPWVLSLWEGPPLAGGGASAHARTRVPRRRHFAPRCGAQHTENDAFLALLLMNTLQVLPLTKQLTNVAGNLWSRSLRVRACGAWCGVARADCGGGGGGSVLAQGARAERIEYLLLHSFHNLKFVVPDKARSRARAHAGGGGGGFT